MENTIIRQSLDLLANRLNLTSLNETPEEYILSEKEELIAINHAIKLAKELFQMKQLEKGEKINAIETKIFEIDWMERIDRENILKIANSGKHYEIWQREKREQERLEEIKRVEEINQLHTAKFIFNIMRWVSKNAFGKDLVVNEHNKPLITALCFYISKDERFESELKFSFKKGLLIRGVSGLGKTFLINCIKDNEVRPISVFSMIEISEAVKEEGVFDLPITKKIMYLDDVGTEEPVINHYGTKINFFKNFVEKYYLTTNDYSNLIISTNNNFSELEDKYGFRVRSRLREMFNIINVSGIDMRV